MKCSRCGRLFGSQSELDLHMQQEHQMDDGEEETPGS
jgi:hypothetical protein